MKRPAPKDGFKNVDKKRVAFDLDETHSENLSSACDSLSTNASNAFSRLNQISTRCHRQSVGESKVPLALSSETKPRGCNTSIPQEPKIPVGISANSPHANYRRVFADSSRPTSLAGFGVSTHLQSSPPVPHGSMGGRKIVAARPKFEPPAVLISDVKDSEDAQTEGSFILPMIYREVCVISILAYIASMYFMWAYLIYWKPPNLKPGSIEVCGRESSVFADEPVSCWESPTFRMFSMITSTMFFASFVQGAISLVHVHDSRRSAIICVMTINGLSLCTHLIMASGAMPVFFSPWGREMHVARWAEWVSLVFLLMVLMHSLDCRDFKRCAKSVTMQSLSVVIGLLASLLPRAWMYTACVLMACSTIAYCDIFIILVRALGPSNVVDPSNSSNFQTLRAQSILLVLACTVTWTLFVVVYFVGMANTVSPVVESMLLSVIDVVAKMLYASVLCQAHLYRLNPEEMLRDSLKLKERANEAQRCFLRYVFHEVRVPLNTISLGLQTIKLENAHDRDDSQGVLDCMEEACSSMSETLDDVLSYQKIEEGRLELSFNPLEARALVFHVVANFQSVAKTRQLVLTSAVDENLPRVLIGDAIRIKQVLNNFVSNAIKFSEDGKVIRIEVKLRQVQADTCTVAFSVTDEGVGISDEDQTKLFQAFSQVRPGDLQQGRGSGLGLCICKNIITLHGGRIGVRSRPGYGSTFFFELSMEKREDPQDPSRDREEAPPWSSDCKLNEPIVDHARGAATTTSESFHRADSGSPASRTICGGDFSTSSMKDVDSGANSGLRYRHAAAGKHGNPKRDHTTTAKESSVEKNIRRHAPDANTPESCPPQGKRPAETKTSDSCPPPGKRAALVVDDVTSNRKLAKMTLTRFGYICDEAVDGIQGFEMALKKGYNIILMDNVMPKMTGVESARKIRESLNSSGTKQPLIFGITGNALSEDVNEFKQAGCNEVLTKPMHIPALKSLLIRYGEIEGS